MGFAIEEQQFPIREDADGAWRVGKSRVLLELTMQAFDQGATPEEIVQQYPSLDLADVYGVIAWCLNHPRELELYLQRREAADRNNRAKIEKQFPQAGIRARLQARLAKP